MIKIRNLIKNLQQTFPNLIQRIKHISAVFKKKNNNNNRNNNHKNLDLFTPTFQNDTQSS